MNLFRRTIGPVSLTDRHIDITWVVAGAIALQALALLAIALPESVPKVVTVPPIVVALILLPGGLALLAYDGTDRITLQWVIYTIGLSLILVMGCSAVFNVVLRSYGFERPMTTVPLAVGFTVLVVGLAAALLLVRSDETVVVPTPSPQPLLFALALVPLLSIMSVKLLNVTNVALPIIVVLTIIAVIPLALVTFADESWYGFGLWTMAIAIVYHKALARLHNFSGSPDPVYTYNAGYWRPGLAENTPEASELLANSVLFPTIAHLTELPIFTEMEVINPLFISIIPVCLYLAGREYVGERRALLVGTLFAFAHPFYMQYPPGGRAGTPVIFMGLFALALADGEYDARTKQVLALLFSLGVVVSHYGTSYLLMFGLIGAAGLLLVFPMADQVFEYVRARYHAARTDGGVRTLPNVRERLRETTYGSGVLTYPFVSFYAAADLAWYLYLDAGEKFHLLPNHIVNVDRLLEANLPVDRSTDDDRTGGRLLSPVSERGRHVDRRRTHRARDDLSRDLQHDNSRPVLGWGPANDDHVRVHHAVRRRRGDDTGRRRGRGRPGSAIGVPARP